VQDQQLVNPEATPGHNQPPPSADHVVLARTLQEKVSDWYALKSEVARLTAAESALRKEIFAEAFPDAKEKGSARHGLGFGKDLKGEAKLNYTLDREGLATLAASAKPEVAALLGRVVRYKPEVVEAEVVKVKDPEEKKLLASFITSKPSMPSLEIVDEKKR
jgi:hypothetical protein